MQLLYKKMCWSSFKIQYKCHIVSLDCPIVNKYFYFESDPHFYDPEIKYRPAFTPRWDQSWQSSYTSRPIGN